MQPLILQGTYDRAETGFFGEWETTLWTGAGSLLPFSFGQSELYNQPISKSFTMDCRSGQEGLQRPTDQDGHGTGCEWIELLCALSVL